MIRTLIKKEAKENIERVPDSLVREEINGNPYFYKNYKAVLNNEETLGGIMGASGLQSLMIEILLHFLFQHIGRKKYRFFTNEVGGHLEKGTNLSFDIAVFDKKILPFDKIDEYYINVPPRMVFEIDVKIDLEKQKELDYVNAKTEKLLAYGTELIIWVLTKQKKLLIARPNSEWKIIKWSEDVELIEGQILNLGELIEKEKEEG